MRVESSLNDRALDLCRSMIDRADHLRVIASTTCEGTQLVDCGIRAAGGLEAGRCLAEVCMAGLGRVEFVPSEAQLNFGPSVMVTTDHPLLACMASQYAGWRIASGKFFAMGSGPMRAAAASEDLFDRIDYRERPRATLGILEAPGMPPDEVCRDVAQKCGLTADRLTLLVAPTASLAGTVQVVARSIETALHKLFELGFDLHRVESAMGTAPLPPVARDDLAAIGRTNDAILYGGQVVLWVRGDDASLLAIGPKVPSSASPDHGQPFVTIFARANHDFYKIDPHLFSPAVVTLANLDSGNTFRFGRLLPMVLHASFDVRGPIA